VHVYGDESGSDRPGISRVEKPSTQSRESPSLLSLFEKLVAFSCPF
jgi:hypothetical protein